jgi:hypothetical protein
VTAISGPSWVPSRVFRVDSVVSRDAPLGLGQDEQRQRVDLLKADSNSDQRGQLTELKHGFEHVIIAVD